MFDTARIELLIEDSSTSDDLVELGVVLLGVDKDEIVSFLEAVEGEADISLVLD